MPLEIEYKDIDEIQPATRNPKLHVLEDIIASIKKHGFNEVILINDTTGRAAHGHGRFEALQTMKARSEPAPDNIIVRDDKWLAPTIKKHFKSEKEAESYAISVNKLVEKGGWNKGLLDEMVQELEPIGFEILKEIDQDIEDALEEMETNDAENRINIKNEYGLIPTKQEGYQGVGTAKVDKDGFHDEKKKTYRCDFEAIPGELQGIVNIDEYHIFPSSNKWGIPDLLPNKILQEIPQPLKTWGGKEITPDDGTSYYLYVFGSTSSVGVPYERALMSWWCHDSHLRTFLETPSWRVKKMWNAQIVGAVVPDVSLWEGNPLVLHLHAIYQAQWLGRFMQEAGIDVIPRFEYFLPETREFSLLGVPKNPPTLATQLHTGFSDEHIPRIKESLLSGLKLLEPGQFLVYVSSRGADIIEDIRNDLPVQEIILLPTAKKVRRGSRAEMDPVLRKLRQKKRGWEGKPKEVIEDGEFEDES